MHICGPISNHSITLHNLISLYLLLFFHRQDKFTSHLEDMKASILTLNEMMMSQGRDIHLLKTTERSDQKIDKLSKLIQNLSATMNTKLEHTVNAVKRGELWEGMRSVYLTPWTDYVLIRYNVFK
mgnify:FL=1